MMCRYSRSVRPARKPRKLGGPKTNAAIRRARKLREEWIALPVPAIVDEASFQQAQAQLARNAALSFRRNTERRYLLRCLLTCGIGSGVRMIGARRSHRVRAWQIVKAASEWAAIHVLALRASGSGGVGEPAPVHPTCSATRACARSCGTPAACRWRRRSRRAGRASTWSISPSAMRRPTS